MHQEIMTIVNLISKNTGEKYMKQNGKNQNKKQFNNNIWKNQYPNIKNEQNKQKVSKKIKVFHNTRNHLEPKHTEHFTKQTYIKQQRNAHFYKHTQNVVQIDHI